MSTLSAAFHYIIAMYGFLLQICFAYSICIFVYYKKVYLKVCLIVFKSYLAILPDPAVMCSISDMVAGANRCYWIADRL